MLEKKSHKEITNSKIADAFLKRVSQSKIVASFTYIMNSGRTIEYFDEKEFNNFLYNKVKVSKGILQQFLHPKTAKNTVIKIIWSPNVSLFECKENQKEICDLRHGIFERAATLEDQEFYSRSVTLKGIGLKKKIKASTERIIRHVKLVSENICIKRMVTTWKIDNLNRLCLLSVLSLRIASNAPLDIGTSIKIPTSIKNSIKADWSRLMCSRCSCIVETQKLYKLPHHFITQSSTDKILPYTNQPNKGDSLYHKESMMVCCDCYICLLYTSDAADE